MNPLALLRPRPATCPTCRYWRPDTACCVRPELRVQIQVKAQDLYSGPFTPPQGFGCTLHDRERRNAPR